MTGIVIPDGGTIGSASDTDAISIASDGQLTISQNNPTVTLGSNTTLSSTVSLTNATFPGYTGGNFTAGNEYHNITNYSGTETAGHVINAYHTFRGDSDIRNSTTATIDGVFMIVTPKSASSRFLLMHCGYGYYDSGADGTVYLKLFRHISSSPARASATDISENFSSSTGTNYYNSLMNGYIYNVTYNDMTFKLDWQGIDHPNTTDKVGYYIETVSSGVQYRYPQGQSYLTILELAG